MRNGGLDETQAEIKFAGRNTNNLRYTDDITVMAESREELKRLLMKVKEESEKVGLKAQHSEIWDHGIQPNQFMANRWSTMETVRNFIFWGSKITADGNRNHEIKDACSLEERLWPT